MFVWSVNLRLEVLRIFLQKRPRLPRSIGKFLLLDEVADSLQGSLGRHLDVGAARCWYCDDRGAMEGQWKLRQRGSRLGGARR